MMPSRIGNSKFNTLESSLINFPNLLKTLDSKSFGFNTVPPQSILSNTIIPPVLIS